VGKTRVRVESIRENLRLRWSHQGKRHYLSLGLYDSPVARKVAEGKATIIEADLMTGNFDPTLKKYRGDEVARHSKNSITVVELFNQIFQHRSKGFTGNTHERYNSVSKRLRAFFNDRPAVSVNEEEADRFRESMNALLPATQGQYLGLVSAAWNLGLKKEQVTLNPWIEVSKVQVPPKQRPRPFTTEEMTTIIEGFQASPHYSCYTDFVRFLFGTGCRTGEAIGLRWGHLSEDCRKVWIGESVTRGKRKATKTNKAREFKLPNPLATLLQERKPESHISDDLVFSALKGGTIDTHNFRRAWIKVLAAAVEYRNPYNTRHTFISHALAKGGNPVAISQTTGHDVETLFKYYAADIQGGLQCPDIFA
jgi:integrase